MHPALCVAASENCGEEKHPSENIAFFLCVSNLLFTYKVSEFFCCKGKLYAAESSVPQQCQTASLQAKKNLSTTDSGA